MTTRRTRSNKSAKAEDPSLEEVAKIPQEDLETFFTDPTPEEVEAQLPPASPKPKSIPITGKVFLGEEDMRQWDAYRNFLYDQGIKRVRHKNV